MQDPFGRTISYLRISVTDRCNLRCRYCMPDGYLGSETSNSVLSYEELALVGEAMVRCGVRKFRLTGGEPLDRRVDAQARALLSAANAVYRSSAASASATRLQTPVPSQKSARPARSRTASKSSGTLPVVGSSAHR